MRKIYFLLLTLFSILSAQQNFFAQTTLTIPAANTNSGSDRKPLGGFFGFERSAIIYTADELGSLGGAVQSIGFFVNSVSSPADAVDVRIYIKTRTSDFAGVSTTYATETTGATLVYGPTTIAAASFVANQWRTITLATPYFYTGGSNLEIIIETNATGGGNEGGSSKQFRTAAQANGNLFQTWQADGTAPGGTGTLTVNRPNAQITILAPTCANPMNAGTINGPIGTLCPGMPFNLSVAGASFGTGITFQWQAFDGTTWNDIPGATNSTLTASLSPTAQQFRRRMTCSGSDVTTPAFAPSVTPPVSVFPWTENFDGLGAVGTASFPSCWFKQNGDWQTANAGTTGLHDPRSGSNYLVELWSATNEFIWTNGFQLTAGTSYDFSFWFTPDGTAGWVGDVLVNSVQNSPGATQLGASFITAAQVPPVAYQQVTRTFVPATTGTYYFAIRVNAPFAPNFLGFDDFRLELTPPCSAPTGLSATAITNTTATLNWAASVTPPAGGYNWEVRTSGAAGSGAAGLAASGTTAAGVLTVNVPGLTANTAYTFYVRSACNPPVLVSAWSLGSAFRTLCNTLTSFPYTETFETTSTTRDCWQSVVESGSINWIYATGPGSAFGTTTTAHGGTLNAQHFGGGSGTVAKLVSPAFDFSGFNPAFGAQLTFWYVNEDWAGDQNELRVFYRTSTSGTWTQIPGAVFSSNVATWTEVEILLPNSISADYQIAFEGMELFGRGIGIDDVVVGPAPSCPKPQLVTAVGVSTSSIIVSFNAIAGSGYIVEYGAPGFTPGTGATPGTGGTVVLGATSPITISSGLTANTAYDIYVRRVCAPGDLSVNVKTTASTLCAAVNVPYLQTFESGAMDATMPTCTSVQDVNGSSGPVPNTTGGQWTIFDNPDPAFSVSPTKVLRYIYDLVNPARPADDWFYTQGLNLTGGTSYRLKFYYRGSDGPTWFERLEVKYGTSAYNSAMTNTLFTNNNILSSNANPFDSAMVDFTPATTGVYYLGFHAMSLADQAFLSLDNISVKLTPLVDVGVPAVTLPTACPSGSAVLKATVRNYNLGVHNFATQPVTVTADITGPTTASVNTTINTGTLNGILNSNVPSTMTTVDLPGVNLTAGLYTITVTATNANDPETANNTYTTTFFVNPSPATPVITPAAPLICVGDSVLLSSQFVTPAPAPVTLPLVSSGNINLAIPDLDPVGINHTLAVAGVPATATVTNVTVTFNVTHTWVADLIINLRAPNGKIINLVNRKGGANSNNFTNTQISSTSTTAIPGTGAPYTGIFRADAATVTVPAGFASNTNNFTDLFQIPNGNWTLAINDNGIGDDGPLVNWSISVTYGTPHPELRWTPITGLFTNSATTTAYVANANAYSVYAEPNVTTTYTATAIYPATGCASSTPVTVTLREPAINFVPPQRVCLSDTAIALIASPSGGTWAGIGIQGSNFLPPRTGIGQFNATYTYTDQNNCTNVDTLILRVVDCPDRIILLRDNAVKLWPNPNNGRFFFQMNSTLYNRVGMHVYNADGKVIQTRQYQRLAYSQVVEVDLTGLPGGTYMIHFFYDGGVRTSEKTFKVVIGR